MTKQEIFDKVVTHLLTQKVKAAVFDPETGAEACRYRDDCGNKCAVGCLIPDDLYSNAMESLGVGTLLDRYPSLESVLPSEYRTMLWDLQQVHDGHEPDQWTCELKILAAKYGLGFNPPEAGAINDCCRYGH